MVQGERGRACCRAEVQWQQCDTPPLPRPGWALLSGTGRDGVRHQSVTLPHHRIRARVPRLPSTGGGPVSRDFHRGAQLRLCERLLRERRVPLRSGRGHRTPRLGARVLDGRPGGRTYALPVSMPLVPVSRQLRRCIDSRQLGIRWIGVVAAQRTCGNGLGVLGEIALQHPVQIPRVRRDHRPDGHSLVLAEADHRDSGGPRELAL